jgi:hypothetical protein
MLACGDLSRGFARVVCRACDYGLLVPLTPEFACDDPMAWSG